MERTYATGPPGNFSSLDGMSYSVRLGSNLILVARYTKLHDLCTWTWIALNSGNRIQRRATSSEVGAGVGESRGMVGNE